MHFTFHCFVLILCGAVYVKAPPCLLVVLKLSLPIFMLAFFASVMKDINLNCLDVQFR